MKAARFFGGILFCLGLVLTAGSVGLCFWFRDADPWVRQIPQEAQACTEELIQALERGDFDAAADRMYGQPDLGVSGERADDQTAMIWDAFARSMTFSFDGDCVYRDGGFCRDVTVTTLDVAALTESAGERAHTLLTQRVEQAQDMSELYDEENNFRQDLVDEVFYQAVEEAVEAQTDTVTDTATLQLVYEDGQWWVLPDQTFLRAISGGQA